MLGTRTKSLPCSRVHEQSAPLRGVRDHAARSVLARAHYVDPSRRQARWQLESHEVWRQMSRLRSDRLHTGHGSGFAEPGQKALVSRGLRTRGSRKAPCFVDLQGPTLLFTRPADLIWPGRPARGTSRGPQPRAPTPGASRPAEPAGPPPAVPTRARVLRDAAPALPKATLKVPPAQSATPAAPSGSTEDIQYWRDRAMRAGPDGSPQRRERAAAAERELMLLQGDARSRSRSRSVSVNQARSVGA